MTKRTIARPVPVRWLSGPAWLKDGAVFLDYSRGSVYDPLAEPRLGIELMAVKTPDDAVAFAERFGLLELGAAALGVLLTRQVAAREPLATFLDAAAALREIAETIIRVRKAASGDAAALDSLRRAFVSPRAAKVTPPRFEEYAAPPKQIPAPESDRALLLHASDWACWQLSIGLKETRAFVYDRAGRGESVPPGQLRMGSLPRTLLDTCYQMTAFTLSDKEPLDVCPECQRVFLVERGQQKYCAPKCASRARLQKFLHDNPDYYTKRRKGQRHGKGKPPTRARRR